MKSAESIVNERLSITKKELPCLDSSWHYHAQYELIYISKSNGIRFVGDSVSPFFPGDLVLVGPFLPHLFLNDESYDKNDRENKVKTIVLKFKNNFMGEDTFEQPEFAEIKQMLGKSKYGLSFGKIISGELHDDLMKITELSPAGQSIKMMELLLKLSQTDDCEVLSSSDMRQYTTENSDRLDTVLKYISDNYQSSITLEDVAGVACMTTNSFCRFFKKMTNKSFTQFLNEIRVRNASRILVQDHLPVSDVCYMVGYKSITNFNRQFKQIMELTPNAFRKSI